MKKRDKKRDAKKIKIKEIKSKKIKILEIKSEESKLEKATEEDNQFHNSINLSPATGSFLSILPRINISQQSANPDRDIDITSATTTRAEPRAINAPDYSPAQSNQQEFREYENPIEPTTLKPVNFQQNFREPELSNKNWQMRNQRQDNWNQEERITPEIVSDESILPFENQERKYRNVKL